jgi:hypothetical protein
MGKKSSNSRQQKFDQGHTYSRATRHPKLRGEIAEMAFLLKAVWYILPLEAFVPLRQLRLYPNGGHPGPGRFASYKKAWHLLT